MPNLARLEADIATGFADPVCRPFRNITRRAMDADNIACCGFGAAFHAHNPTLKPSGVEVLNWAMTEYGLTVDERQQFINGWDSGANISRTDGEKQAFELGQRLAAKYLGRDGTTQVGQTTSL